MTKDDQQQIKQQLSVYFIMGTTNTSRHPLDVVKEAIQGGITMFQFREKGEGALQGEEKKQLARDIQALCQEANVPFIVNDDVQLAVDLDADGVHVGQEDTNAQDVRQRIGNKLLGRVDKPSHSLSVLRAGAHECQIRSAPVLVLPRLQRFSITLTRRQRAKIKIILALCQHSKT